MLITFKSPVAGDTTYVGPIGERFLRMMGMSGNVPGAMMADEVPEALEQFKRELQRIEAQEREAAEALKEREQEKVKNESEDENKKSAPRPVPTSQRAYPLIQLLEKSADAGCEVVWE